MEFIYNDNIKDTNFDSLIPKGATATDLIITENDKPASLAISLPNENGEYDETKMKNILYLPTDSDKPDPINPQNPS